MREDGKEMHKTGNGQSPGNKTETGNQQANNSKKGACGEIIRGIEKIGDLLGGKSISTVQTYVRMYGLPAERDKNSVWFVDLDKFKSWAAAIGWTKQMHESDLRIQVRKKALQEAGPGKIVEARNLDALAKRLFSDVGRLQSYLRWENCPIQKNDDGSFKVDLNQWELFQIEHRVGPYLLTGKRSKGRIAWN
jgi:hypothetical protein